MMILDSATL